ncbi:MAG: hypothetical protein OSB09_07610 [Planctomycetota bacterium]|nr:hypothetical protein [Planctomycetota bacterium]
MRIILLLVLVCGCGLPHKDIVSSTAIQATTEEWVFVDKGARAKPHPSPQGRYSDKFPNILLTDHTGVKHRFYEDLVKDRRVVIQFFYTTCSGI